MTGSLGRSLRSPRVLIALGMVVRRRLLRGLLPACIAPHDPDRAEPAVDPDAAGMGARRRSAVSARHRQPRPRRAVAPALRRPHRDDGGAVRFARRHDHRQRFWRTSPAISAARWTGSSAALVDVWMSFPPVILSLILMVGLGVGLDRVILAIVLVDWTRFCRVLRSEVLVVTRHDYVAAARLLGFTHWQTIVREVLPATLPLLITLVSLEMAIAVVVEAILSFVGLGVGPDQAAWGQMIADARQIRLSVAVESAAADIRDLLHRRRVQSAGRRVAPHARRAACGNRTLTPC